VENRRFLHNEIKVNWSTDHPWKQERKGNPADIPRNPPKQKKGKKTSQKLRRRGKETTRGKERKGGKIKKTLLLNGQGAGLQNQWENYAKEIETLRRLGIKKMEEE